LLRDGTMSNAVWKCTLIATLAIGCAARDEIAPFVQAGKADGLPDRLYKLDDHKLHVDEPSDLAIAGGLLYTVSDAHSKIYQIDNDGDVRGELDINGQDLEALVARSDGDYMVADETSAKIWHIDSSGARHDPIEIKAANDGNSGIEGLALLPFGRLLIAKEKHPARLIELDAEGNTLWDDKIHFANDLSALTYNTHDHHIYALSDEDQALYRLDSDYNVETAWKLPVQHPEGIAFDGSVIYICSDSEQRLYLFELE
jgi:uncharacterized protein YjiK